MAGQWRGPSVWRSPYTRGEAEQFKALAELGHQANLGDTIGADLSWFEKEEQSKTFRSISATQHLNPRNLTAEGGVFALLCHQLRESIQQYLEERKSKHNPYPNDPLNCFFAELMDCLTEIASQTYANDIERLHNTVQKRHTYLNAVFGKVFKASWFRSRTGLTKGHVIAEAIHAFDCMEQDITNVKIERTLVDELHVLNIQTQALVMHATNFVKTAYCQDLKTANRIKLAELLDNSKRHAKFLKSSLGQSLLCVLKGPAGAYAVPTRQDRGTTAIEGTVARDRMVEVQTRDPILHTIFRDCDGVQSITDLLYWVNTAARSAVIIKDIITTADNGGRLLVLGVCKEQVRRWLRVSMACLEQMNECLVFHEKRVQDHLSTIAKKNADPMADEWMRRSKTLKGKGGHNDNLRSCCEVLRDLLTSFEKKVAGFHVREVADEAIKAMEQMAVRANTLYNDVAPALGFAPLVSTDNTVAQSHTTLTTNAAPLLPPATTSQDAPAAVSPNDAASGQELASSDGADRYRMVMVDRETHRDPVGMVVVFKKVFLATETGTLGQGNVRVAMSKPNPGFRRAFEKKTKLNLEDKANVCFSYIDEDRECDVVVDERAMLELTKGIEVSGDNRNELKVDKTLHLRLTAWSPAVHPSGVVDYTGLLGCDSLYDVLGITRAATDKDIKKAAKQLLLRVSSDKVNHAKLNMSYNEQQYVQAKIIEARNILLDPVARDEHNRLLDSLHGTDWSSYMRRRLRDFRAKWQAMYRGDGTNDHRNRYFWTGIALFLGGVITFATVVTAGAALPIALGVGAAAGAMMSGGVGAAAFAFNNAQSQFSRLKFLKHLFIYGIFGAAAGTGVGALTMIGPYLGIGVKAVEGLAEGAIEGGVIATSVGVGDISTKKELQSLKAGGKHLLGTLAIGAVTGSVFGAALAGPGSAPARAVLSRTPKGALAATVGTSPDKHGWNPFDLATDTELVIRPDNDRTFDFDDHDHNDDSDSEDAQLNIAPGPVASVM